ncbi:MAG TPA: metalloregulator ArsR/SmtB family transcription factor [Burkholderiales bacterium]|nr:metalloregulator ArsR/SmtB family transcription factor [Burkholderiales bacterium]
MVKYSSEPLDAIFTALADPTRRRVVKALSGGSLPVTALARPFAMSLPGFMKHLRILEDAGLITREKEGRVVSCTLAADPMKKASEWLDRTREFWEKRLDALARFLYHQEETQAWRTPKRRSARRSRSYASSMRHRRRSGGR